MPDEELSSKAADDSLLKKEVLAQQILRMISDERSIAFVDQFTRQWLNLDVVDRVSISKDYHPGFSNTLKQDMVGETQQFFARLCARKHECHSIIGLRFHHDERGSR